MTREQLQRMERIEKRRIKIAAVIGVIAYGGFMVAIVYLSLKG